MTEIRMDFDFGHPPALVWRALTERWQLARWFMPGEIEPIQGSRFELLPYALPGFDGPISGQVLEVSAERRLAMRWKGEQLHTRVVWELKPTREGCLLMVSQTGFLGVRGSERRQALVSTYDRLFGELLPAVLDRLAGKDDPPRPRPARSAAPVPSRPDRRRQILAIAAAALLIGLVAALLANLPSESSVPAEAGASGTSSQPASFVPATASTAASSSPAAPRLQPSSPSARPGAASIPPGSVTPSTSRRVEPATSAPPRAAALAARYSTLSSGALTYRGQVVVQNTGGTRSDRWALTITVPLLATVQGVEGPRPSQSGAAWTFSGSGVAAGGSARVVFDVVLDVGSILGATRPLSCRVGGEDCAGL